MHTFQLLLVESRNAQMSNINSMPIVFQARLHSDFSIEVDGRKYCCCAIVSNFSAAFFRWLVFPSAISTVRSTSIAIKSDRCTVHTVFFAAATLREIHIQMMLDEASPLQHLKALMFSIGVPSRICSDYNCSNYGGSRDFRKF